MTFKEGFIFREFKFALKNQILYRLPTIKNGQSYSMREVPVIPLSKTGKGYRLIRAQKSLAQVRSMIEKVNWKVKDNCKECL